MARDTNSGAAPEVAVVVPSHDRPVRLRWLLNALAEQTLDRSRFEVIVGHDSSGPETEALLTSHPLAQAGVLRHVTLEPGTAPPGANRNAAWRIARAPVIAFTDDDCRPPAEWLERALTAAREHPGAIIQGRTEPDPEEEHLMNGPHSRSQLIEPPGPYAQACNIIYPRAVLEALGGYDEEMLTGEDAELAWRARQAGVPYVGAPEVLTWHAVATRTLIGHVRSIWRWRHLPELVRRHPSHRVAYPMRIFWKRTHVWLPLAVAGVLMARRNPATLLLVLPWASVTGHTYGSSPRARARQLSELPGRAAIDLTEFATMAWGSVQHRTLFL